MSLFRYVVRRVIYMVLVVLGIATIVFFITRVLPGDPVGAILGPQAPPDVVDRIRREYGFDKPIYIQYIDFIANLIRGDLGKSISTNRPVIDDLRERFPATFELATASLVIALILGIPLGIMSAIKKDKPADHIIRIVSLFGVSMPVFWLGLILLLIFYYILGILPGPGRLDPYIMEPPRITGLITIDSLISGNFDAFRNAVAHLILPASVLGYLSSAYIARITRASILETLRQEHVKFAISKGLPKNTVLLRHVIRPSLIPIITVVGLVYGGLLEGAVLTETIFGWPGLGSYLTRAMIYMDYNAIVGGVIIIAIIYSVVNLVVDIIYAYIDPRIKYG
ncbi:MAG: ABC transporter permease [Sulfolobales archaeon]